MLSSFFALSSSFTGGVRVGFAPSFGSSSDPAILAGAGLSGGPQVAPFNNLTGTALANFFALPQGFTGGLFIAGKATKEIQRHREDPDREKRRSFRCLVLLLCLGLLGQAATGWPLQVP